MSYVNRAKRGYVKENERGERRTN